MPDTPIPPDKRESAASPGVPRGREPQPSPEQAPPRRGRTERRGRGRGVGRSSLPPDTHEPPTGTLSVYCERDGDAVRITQIVRSPHALHRSVWDDLDGPIDPEVPEPDVLAAVLRAADGRALARTALEMGLVHYHRWREPGPRSWAEPSGVYDCELPDDPAAARLEIVDGHRVLLALDRPAHPPVIRDVRAVVVAAGDLDHPRAAGHVPDEGMLHLTWTDDSQGGHYERSVHWATPEQPNGAWTGYPEVGEPRGVAVTSLGTIPPGAVQVRVRLTDGWHVVDSAPVVVQIPVDRAVTPVRRDQA